MWYVSGLSCRKFGSCHSHIDGCGCLCSHWNHLFLSFFHPFMCIYAMNWMNFWFFCFCFFSCSFWWSYNNTVVLFCQYIFCIFISIFSFIICFICYYFIICLYFLLFSINFIRTYNQFSTLCIDKRNYYLPVCMCDSCLQPVFFDKNPRSGNFVWITFLLIGDLIIDVWKSRKLRPCWFR